MPWRSDSGYFTVSRLGHQRLQQQPAVRKFGCDQLAGDLVPSPSIEQIIATGYNRLLQTTHEGGLQQKEYRTIYAADRIRNVSAVWMGATVGCAQCHDHKFDPYTAQDFYSLGAGKALAHGTAAMRGVRRDLPHHPPRVKNVIFLCMARGPSHLETFDYKPQLNVLNGQPIAQLQVEFNSSGAPVHYVSNPPGITKVQQRSLVNAVTELDGLRNAELHNPEVDSRIAANEVAFRMQSSVPELTDMSHEPKHILEAYGAVPGDGSFASNCLLARRLLERGVRFIHLYHRGWDHHDNLVKYMNICCHLTDLSVKALLTDLKQRGLLDEILIIWGGEFGRTPMIQYKGGVGRDHHIKGFSMWMAGGGVESGTSYGNTDELGYHAIENPVHVRDLHATMLHLLGIDHQRFSVPYQGLDMRLTGVEPARVLHAVCLRSSVVLPTEIHQVQRHQPMTGDLRRQPCPVLFARSSRGARVGGATSPAWFCFSLATKLKV